jgi:hypothetical protein
MREEQIDQAAILDNLQSRRNIHGMAMNGGICAALVMDWLNFIAVRPRSTQGRYRPGTESCAAAAANHFASAFANVYAGSQSRYLAGNNTLTIEVAATSEDDIVEPILNADLVGGLAYVRISGDYGAHAIGVCRRHGQLRVFDPNYGIFRARDLQVFERMLYALIAGAYEGTTKVIVNRVSLDLGGMTGRLNQ